MSREQPPDGRNAEPAGGETVARRGKSTPPGAPNHARTNRPGPRGAGTIGEYRLKREIARGGMGTVYEAVQRSPHRVVALKVMRTGVSTRTALRRFEYESQLLARLRHPGIAQVYEAGTHDDFAGSVPYFAMEYIPNAKSITQYARDKKLAVREKLELFVQVCDAIHHGHSKGIIHRDLKPGNILVDAHGQVKIIDFGVARATDSDMAATTVQTAVGDLVGTLRYMSPEQYAADPNILDARSDVYALGVVLYELLAGELPCDLGSAGAFDVPRLIREETPRALRAFDKTLRGDLETIVGKALEKDRDRRYQSAHALGDDIARYLRNDPIVAVPPSVWYGVRLFARRNKLAFAAGVTILFILFAATLVSLSLYGRAEGAREEAVIDRDRALAAERVAEQQRKEAQRQGEMARAALSFLRTMLASAQPDLLGRDVRVLDILDEASRQLERGQVHDPAVEAMARLAIGSTFLQFDRHDAASLHLQQARRLFERAYGPSHPDLADTLFYLGWLETRKGQYDDAKSIYQHCLAMRQALFGPNDERVARTLRKLGALYRHTGELSEAETTLERALSICRNIGASADATMAETLSELALLHNQTSDYDRAEPYAREALAIYRNLHGPHHAAVATAMTRLAAALRGLGRLQEAEKLFRTACDTRQDLYGRKSTFVAETLVELSYTLRDRGAYEEAEQALEEALSILRAVYDQPSLCIVNSELALAKLLDVAGKPEEAADLFPKVISDYAAMFKSDQHFYVANARSIYGDCLLRLGRYQLAEQQLLMAYKALTTGEVAHGKAGLAASRLAALYEERGNHAEAARWRLLERSHQ